MIYRYNEVTEDLSVGGKAKGLGKLHQIGFTIPEFLVITPQGHASFFENPESHYSWMSKGNKAVRSSGMREDGAAHSFAGQFESYLNVNGAEEILQAVKDCIASGETERVKEYDANTLDSDKENGVAVIIQEMIDAKYAGVAFSVDPVTGRRDLSVINIVEGLGDKLVDGKAEPEHIQINKHAQTEAALTSKYASDAILKELIDGLALLKKELGSEVDVEWAVDQNDQLYWLQVRPITTLSNIHPNELDSKLAHENEVLTRANIGEMMPGHLTPLSLSTFGRAIEYGIQDFYMQCGVQKEIFEEHFNIKYFYNHGFISLTGLYAISDAILLPKNEYIEYSILGRELDRKSPENPKNKFIQIKNQVKQLKYFGKAKKRLLKLQEMCDQIHQPKALDIDGLYAWIDSQLPNLDQAYSYHYCTSGKSGSQYSALISIISGGPKPTAESNTYASHFLRNIDGIVGADSIQQLKNIAKEISNSIENSASIEDDVLLKTIQEDNGKLGSTYHQFIKDHGHRCVREAEFIEKDWSQDPMKLIPVLRNIVKSGQFESVSVKFEMNEAMATLPKIGAFKKAMIKKFANSTREAVAMREMSKSTAIKFQQKIKFAYIELAEKLIEKNILQEASDLFYLTHQEIGLLLSNHLENSSGIIKGRKQLDSVYSKMNFQEVYFGHPHPVDEQISEGGNEGTVVSQGKVTGNIKVVRSLEEADKLEKGDIMVCQYTDIGWSPYFAIIGGIITEIGSPLSHGAVVAREYGIPAIVNMHGAMGKYKDNDRVEINTDLEVFIKSV
jgi:pyruvate,water dikinase